jgi:glycosyltransferase involved in cell wall biosynthesis
MRILYHCPCSHGGLAEYSLHQCAAIANFADVEILWHAPASLSVPRGAISITPLLNVKGFQRRGLVHRSIHFVHGTLASYQSLASEIERYRPDAVLLSAWSEYLSPFWASNLRRWRERGVRFGAVIHDPVRDFVRGPLWWHRYSVRQAYSFLDFAFTHDDRVLDTCGTNSLFRTVQIPLGPFLVPNGNASKMDLRSSFAIPKNVYLLLSFGHIRDGKNLDKIIAALPDLPDTHLLVAGREQSGGQKPVAFYRNLAKRLGVYERCHWHTEYIPNEDVWRYYRISDLLLLTYSQHFRSASAVLNVNAQFGLPVLASAGGGPFLDAVNDYKLGVILSVPDSPSIAKAVPLALGFQGEWERFHKDNSWTVNAERVLKALAS